MKKITTLVFACLFGAVAYGQGISGGIKAGLNLANQTFKGNGYTTSPSFLPGIHGGVYATVMFSDHLGIQPEVERKAVVSNCSTWSVKAGLDCTT